MRLYLGAFAALTAAVLIWPTFTLGLAWLGYMIGGTILAVTLGK
jgi:hypothetical protein